MSIIAPLDLDNFINKLSLKEITNPTILSSKGKYDTDGLFSESIFGMDRSKERRKTYAYVKLNTKIIHPLLYQTLKKIEKKIIELIEGETFYINENDGTISKDKVDSYKEISGFDGAIYALTHNVFFRGDTEVRDKLIVKLNEFIKNGLMFIDKMLVIPPDFRPAQMSETGELIGVDEVNSIYIKLINLTKKVKLTENNDKNGVISESSYIRRDIQNLVVELFDYAKMRTGKKSGINRSSLLGKRVDFSGRTVITAGYDLPIGTAGVPYRMLANICEPFLIHHFYKELSPDSKEYETFMTILEKNDFHKSLNVLVLTTFLRDLADGAIKISKEEEQFIMNVFQRILNDKYVLLKRDPSFHKGSWQAYKIKVEDQVAIRLNTASTVLHNADFDGDTMAIYFPITLEGQRDAETLMFVPEGTVNTQQSSLEIKHEYVLSSYTLTKIPAKYETPDLGIIKLDEVRQKSLMEIGAKNHIYQTATVILDNGKKVKTTLGRIIFSAIFPKEFLLKYYNGLIEMPVDSKVMSGNIMQNLFEMYQKFIYIDIVFTMIEALRKYITIYPCSMVLSEMLQASMFDELKKKLKDAKSMPEKQAIIDQIEEKIKKEIGSKMPMLDDIIASGSRGKPNQLRQMLVSKGILQDAQGNLLYIDESYVNGLSPVSTFMGGFGGRKGIMDRSRQTATTGYLYRKLIYALASVIFNEEVDDCGSTKTVMCKVTKKNAKLLDGRYIIDGKKKVLLTSKTVGEFIDTHVNLRTPIYCKTPMLCKTCYGDLMHFYHSKFIGIIAAQSMGERGSQEMMKTFHTGGSTSVEIPDLIEQMFHNNPEIKEADLKKFFVQEGTKLKLNGDYNVRILMKQNEYLKVNMTSFTVLDDERSAFIVENMNIEGTQVPRAFRSKPFSAEITIFDVSQEVYKFDAVIDDGVFIPIDYFDAEEYKNEEGIKVIELKNIDNTMPYLFNVELSSSDMTVIMQTVLNIIERKNIMKHPEVAFNKLSLIYGDDFGIAYNHIEILISQIFRNKAKPELPARLVEPYDAQVYSIKNIAHLESFISGMLFENMSKSLQSGLINDSTIHNPLEKLLSDDLTF